MVGSGTLGVKLSNKLLQLAIALVLLKAEGVDRRIEARDFIDTRKRRQDTAPAIATAQPIAPAGGEAQPILDGVMQYVKRRSATVKTGMGRHFSICLTDTMSCIK